VMLSINLEAQDRDEPIFPWILVDTPILLMEVAFTAGIGYMMESVRN